MTALQFSSGNFSLWLGLGYLSDDAELIIAELVGNAVSTDSRTGPQINPAWEETPRFGYFAAGRIGDVCSRHRPEREHRLPKGAPTRMAIAAAFCIIVGAQTTSWAGPPSEGPWHGPSGRF